MFVPGASLLTLWPVVVLPRDHISNFSFYTQGPEVPLTSGSLTFLAEQAAGRGPTGTEKVKKESRDPEDKIHIWVLKALR